MASEVEQPPVEAAPESNDVAPSPAGEDFPMKHPLQHAWTLWYLESDRNKLWEEMQNIVTTFETVEDFWSLFNHIKQPAELKSGNDYSLFKEGIRPMWEDEANKKGGRWVIMLGRNQKDELNKLWLDTVMCLIGEAFDNSDEVCGAVVNVRNKGDKISLWTANGHNAAACKEIGAKLKERLGFSPKVSITYHMHNDTMVKTGSQTKPTYQL